MSLVVYVHNEITNEFKSICALRGEKMSPVLARSKRRKSKNLKTITLKDKKGEWDYLEMD